MCSSWLRLAVALLPLLAGCAAPVSAPSLEKRAVEARPVLLPEAMREPAAPVDPALTTRLEAIIARAADGHRRFAEQRRAAEGTVAAAAGRAPGSEAWIVAQQAVSALETARGRLREAAADVEDLRSDPVAAGSGGRAAIEAAAGRLDAWDAEEARDVSALAATLR